MCREKKIKTHSKETSLENFQNSENEMIGTTSYGRPMSGDIWSGWCQIHYGNIGHILIFSRILQDNTAF